MAHPYSAHRQTKVEHDRVGHITKDYASGGAVVERAHGGRANKGGATVNVIVAPSDGDKPPMPMAGVGPMPAPPMPIAKPPMVPPGAGIPPGGPPMPGGPIRSQGGRTGYAKGGAVPGPAWKEGIKNGTKVANSPGKNDGKDIGRKRVITYATGGPVEHPTKGGMAPKLDGGAGGGTARLEKEERAERRAGKPT